MFRPWGAFYCDEFSNAQLHMSSSWVTCNWVGKFFMLNTDTRLNLMIQILLGEKAAFKFQNTSETTSFGIWLCSLVVEFDVKLKEKEKAVSSLCHSSIMRVREVKLNKWKFRRINNPVQNQNEIYDFLTTFQ